MTDLKLLNMDFNLSVLFYFINLSFTHGWITHTNCFFKFLTNPIHTHVHTIMYRVRASLNTHHITTHHTVNTTRNLRTTFIQDTLINWYYFVLPVGYNIWAPRSVFDLSLTYSNEHSNTFALSDKPGTPSLRWAESWNTFKLCIVVNAVNRYSTQRRDSIVLSCIGKVARRL